MADIKVKETKKGTIKTLDKATVGTQKIKNRIVETKEKINEQTTQEENRAGTNYAIDKVSNTISNTPYNIKRVNRLNRKGKNSFEETKQNIVTARQKIKYAKKKNHAQKVTKNIIKGSKQAKSTIKTGKTTIKTAARTGKNVKSTVKTTTKASKRAFQIAKMTAIRTAQAIKVAIKATITAIKAIIAGTKALIAAIVAGGWVVVVIVILICLIGLICSSVFGIFFSNEKDVGDKTMSSVVTEINTEFANKITEIQLNTTHDDYEIKSDRAKWKDILSVYAVLVTNGKDQSDVITLDDKKIEKLKSIFWEMNEIDSRVEEIEKDVELINDDGSKTTVKQNRKVLYITITSKSIDEMANKYNFNKSQRQQLEELQQEEYASMWSVVIYGSSAGSDDIVLVAQSQLGNVGGQPYWSWYGFSSRVEWCACFVSWCANECGYIDAGIIPKFAGCQLEGVDWFKACGLWQDGGYTPKPGDIIFFDWKDKHDGFSDHVGIVEKVENGRVYTIEGNSHDSCKENNYDINSSEIQGYGTPAYQ